MQPNNVIRLDDYRRPTARPRVCTRCGKPGPARCDTCVDRFRRRAQKLQPRHEKCTACRCAIEPRTRVAISRDTGAIYCSAWCWREAEVMGATR